MQTVEQLCEQLGSADPQQAYRARRELNNRAAAAGAAGKDAARAELAAALAAALVATKDGKDDRGRDGKQGVYSTAARRDIAQVLSLVAGEAEVAMLKLAVDDFDVRESARFALDRCPLAAATDALCEVAETAVGTEFVVGVANALGRRSGSNVAAALRNLLKSNSIEVRLAAAEALANTPDASLDAEIASVRRGGEPGTGQRGNLRVQRARLRLAETLAAAGQKDAAHGICLAMVSNEKDVTGAQRRATQAMLKRLEK